MSFEASSVNCITNSFLTPKILCPNLNSPFWRLSIIFLSVIFLLSCNASSIVIFTFPLSPHTRPANPSSSYAPADVERGCTRGSDFVPLAVSQLPLDNVRLTRSRLRLLAKRLISSLSALERRISLIGSVV
jgi:hypothetical protein